MIRCDIDGTRKKRRFIVNLSRVYIDSLYKQFKGTSHSYNKCNQIQETDTTERNKKQDKVSTLDKENHANVIKYKWQIQQKETRNRTK
jgi:hypothetical protein